MSPLTFSPKELRAFIIRHLLVSPNSLTVSLNEYPVKMLIYTLSEIKWSIVVKVHFVILFLPILIICWRKYVCVYIYVYIYICLSIYSYEYVMRLSVSYVFVLLHRLCSHLILSSIFFLILKYCLTDTSTYTLAQLEMDTLTTHHSCMWSLASNSGNSDHQELQSHLVLFSYS